LAFPKANVERLAVFLVYYGHNNKSKTGTGNIVSSVFDWSGLTIELKF
jgi:hypothetical protein